MHTNSIKVLLACAGLSLFASTSFAKFNVVATTPDLAALASELLGDTGTVVSLSSSDQDPHWVDARPSLAVKLARADALLLTGMDLEVGWLPSLLQGARNPDVVLSGRGYIDVSTLVTRPIIPPNSDRSQGDVHAMGNPHYTLAADVVAEFMPFLAARLGRLAPDLHSTIDRNLQQWQREYAQFLTATEPSRNMLIGKNIIVYHDAWQYLRRWLQFNQIGTVEPKAGIPPTAQWLFALLQRSQGKASCIIQFSYYPAKAGQMLAQELGINNVVVPGGTKYREQQTYLDFQRTLLSRLSNEC